MTGKKVFITGGAQGIGRAIVKAFVAEGAQVAFCDSNRTEGEKLCNESGATFILVDVSHKEELEACMKHLLLTWGDIDIIVNNVGVSRFSPIIETSVEMFDEILSINLRPVFITSRLLAIHRAKQTKCHQRLYGR
ncbi:MAG: SDR family oxidoreductase, partial [Bacteroides sp.]